MAKRVETETVLKVEEKPTSGKVKVKLKCNYDIVDKDGKVTSKKPDDFVELESAKAYELIGMAFAVKV